MTLSDKIAQHLPYLRRYARALTGSQSSGDAFVRATLEAALSDEDIKASLGANRVQMYRVFNQIWSSANDDTDRAGEQGDVQALSAQQRLSAVTPRNRQALLLTSLEDFSSAQAGEIMGISQDEVDELVRDAIAEIDNETRTEVLIIEDEPLISMQLEDLVRSLGHDICGTAATRTQAQKIVAEKRPGLVLADIQLADGSSGLDAVDDILAIDSVPVVFITAYPERLLTGDRPEPTYLVTKPFQESNVRAAISQALFLNSPVLAD